MKSTLNTHRARLHVSDRRAAHAHTLTAHSSAPDEPPERLSPVEVPERLVPEDVPESPPGPSTTPDPGPPQKAQALV